MYDCHQTVSCPSCGKDSWKSIWEATFVEVECVWCKCKFKFNPRTDTAEISKGKKNG